MSKQTILIDDSQSFVSAQTSYGYDVKTYDDGYGPLWIARNSLGLVGIVRAKSFEQAHEICEDELFPEADETIDEIRAEYNKRIHHVKIVRDGDTERPERETDYVDGKLAVEFVRWERVETLAAEGEDVWPENELFQEAFGFRPNGANASDKHKHGIYSKDLNGEHLDLLTPELATELQLNLVIESCGKEEELEDFDLCVERLERAKVAVFNAGQQVRKGNAISEQQAARLRYLISEIERQAKDAAHHIKFANVVK